MGVSISSGAIRENRTPDLQVTNLLLYQLSYNSIYIVIIEYIPKKFNKCMEKIIKLLKNVDN